MQDSYCSASASRPWNCPRPNPYFAAIALIVEAELPIRTWVPLLGLYNVIFVLPPIALLAGHLVFQKRLADPYASLRHRLGSGAQGVVRWVAGLVGGWLLLTSTIELVARLIRVLAGHTWDTART